MRHGYEVWRTRARDLCSEAIGGGWACFLNDTQEIVQKVFTYAKDTIVVVDDGGISLAPEAKARRCAACGCWTLLSGTKTNLHITKAHQSPSLNLE